MIEILQRNFFTYFRHINCKNKDFTSKYVPKLKSNTSTTLIAKIWVTKPLNHSNQMKNKLKIAVWSCMYICITSQRHPIYMVPCPWHVEVSSRHMSTPGLAMSPHGSRHICISIPVFDVLSSFGLRFSQMNCVTIWILMFWIQRCDQNFQWIFYDLMWVLLPYMQLLTKSPQRSNRIRKSSDIKWRVVLDKNWCSGASRLSKFSFRA